MGHTMTTVAGQTPGAAAEQAAQEEEDAAGVEQAMEELGEVAVEVGAAVDTAVTVATRVAEIVVALLIVFVCCTFILPIGWIVAYWIAYAAKESCDQPLDTWMLVQAITQSWMWCHSVSMVFWIKDEVMEIVQPKDGFSDDLDQILADIRKKISDLGTGVLGGIVCSICVNIFALVWLIMGVVWMSNAGGIFGGDTDSDCESAAPTLFGVMKVTYWFTLVWAGLSCCLCCTFACCTKKILGLPDEPPASDSN